MRIVFCGVGAIGSATAVLCRNLEGSLVFVDFDRVESKNLLAQAYVKPSVGKNKAEALKLQFLNLHGVKTEAFGVRLTRDNVATLCGGADLLVDAFDNQDGRRLLSDFARQTTTPLIHGAVAADGTFGLVRWDEHFVPDAEDNPGQPTCEGGAHLPLLGLLSATLARAIQDFLKHGVKRDSFVTLGAVTPTPYAASST
ncbi:thiamine biosynthesis protein ThiF [Corallococcus sp. H22C18031201]|uniref:ThiF family adenylyltransferase n=1 Tax=Citreicoccus inhibens TaxID=2849499 RepID=UPI000E74DE2D|nr:ThiF family adenylyltransferase [Citreicoccus inhibens]MBU8894289.1 ThiF family adenylyltransferase [Citreicoccus inhibens]RJS23023.1 thiamine biosynthesis protein ThiF [Corallococcus sp. H22C18031201]